MVKVAKKRRISSSEHNYNLRSKYINNNDNKNENKTDGNQSQNCEQIDIISTNMSANITQKLTKMPNKYYNLRRRDVRHEHVSPTMTHKSNVELTNLTDDCLLLIFEHLTTIRDKCSILRVCKRFQFLINRLLRAQKTFSVNTTFGSNPQLHQRLGKNSCKDVIMKCPNLRSFKMPGFYAKDNSTSYVNDRIGDEEMEILSQYCLDLRELEICGCGYVTESGIQKVITKCLNLEKLCISFCTQVTGGSFARLTKKFKQLTLNGNENTPPLVESLKALLMGDGRHLNELNICLYHTIEKQDKIIDLICTNFRDLQCLRYSIFSNKPCSFGSFGKLTNLLSLSFDAESINLTDNDFIKIMSGCSKLKTLFIRFEVSKDSKFTDYSLRKLPLYCPRIEKLNLHSKNDFMVTITDSSIINFVQLKELETLSIKMFRNVGDAVINVIKSCPRLHNLFLLNCMEVTNATIDALIVAAKAQPTKRFKFNVSGAKVKRKKRRLPTNLIDCSTL